MIGLDGKKLRPCVERVWKEHLGALSGHYVNTDASAVMGFCKLAATIMNIDEKDYVKYARDVFPNPLMMMALCRLMRRDKLARLLPGYLEDSWPGGGWHPTIVRLQRSCNA